ncbi:hypothetical protein IWZ03DRAFT_405067 [Phyllosticta citriasiana]|uniref:Uncharacterized protein n=1 Tax=Phyllosticta citriasiana TaxID=595635 RepID=A0ABR1KTP6_9PEZI
MGALAAAHCVRAQARDTSVQYAAYRLAVSFDSDYSGEVDSSTFSSFNLGQFGFFVYILRCDVESAAPSNASLCVLGQRRAGFYHWMAALRLRNARPGPLHRVEAKETLSGANPRIFDPFPV